MTRLIIFAVVVLLIASVPLYSQTSVKLGFQGGINLANGTVDPDLSTTTRTGMMGGAAFEIEFTDVFSIQPELLYVQKGAKFEDTEMGIPFKATLKFDYIEIPVLLKATFGSSDFKPFVFFGPNLGFNIGSELEIEVMGDTETVDTKDETEGTDFCLDFGAGGEFPIGQSTDLFISARYSLGLTDIVKDPDASAKTTGIQIMVGVMFGI
jgi:hypothetical protein